MDLKDVVQQMHDRFDRLEAKVDPYASRLSTLETHVSWLKGHLNVTSAVFMSVGSGVLIWLLTK